MQNVTGHGQDYPFTPASKSLCNQSYYGIVTNPASYSLPMRIVVGDQIVGNTVQIYYKIGNLPYSLVYDTISFTIPGHLHFLTSGAMTGLAANSATDLVVTGPGSGDAAIFSNLTAKLGMYHSQGHKLVPFHTVKSAGGHLTGETARNVKASFSRDGYLRLSTGRSRVLTSSHFRPPVPIIGYVLTGLAPPAVNISPSLTGQTVTISGSARITDPGAKLSSITWQWGDGTTSTSKGLPASHTYAALGTYTVSAVATDNYGSSATSQVEVVIQPPLVSISSSVSGLTATVSGSAVAQATGSQLSTIVVQWGDGTANTITSFPASHAYAGSGAYTITVTATDNLGLSASATTSVYATAPGCGNRCPQ